MQKLYDVQAEHKVLAGLSQYPDTYVTISRTLSAESFYSDKCNKLYRILSGFYDRNPLVRVTTKTLLSLIKDEISNKKELSLYIALIRRLHSINVERSETLFASERVNKLKKWRVITNCCHKVMEGYTNGMSLDVASMVFDDTINELYTDLNAIREGEWGDNLVKRVKEHIDMQKNPDKYKGIPTGILEWDEYTGGARPEDLSAMILPVSKGKSIWLCQVACYAALMQHDVLFITIESPMRRIEWRIDSMLTKIMFEKFRRGQMSKEEIKQWINNIQEMRQQMGRIDIIDVPGGCSAATIKAFFRKREKTYRPKMIVIDYLNILSSNRAIGGSDGAEWKTQLAISLELKRLARELCVPIWTALQLTADNNKEYYTQHDIALSRRILDNLDFALYYTKPQNVLGDMGYRFLKMMKGREVNINKAFCIHPDFDRMLFDTGKRPSRLEIDAVKAGEDEDDESNPRKTRKANKQ